jgi:hypothetical protein
MAPAFSRTRHGGLHPIGDPCIGGTTVFFRERDVRADRDHSLAADLASQRRMPECYRSGCSGISVSPILGCAWRLVILEETHAPDDADADVGLRCSRRKTEADRSNNEGESLESPTPETMVALGKLLQGRREFLRSG